HRSGGPRRCSATAARIAKAARLLVESPPKRAAAEAAVGIRPASTAVVYPGDGRKAATIMTQGRVLFASLVGTTIEFFDFYIYGTAAVLVFPQLFFPAGNQTTAMLQSLATFALAFFARPIGSALFGHFGDRIGRKATLVAALLTMGL